VSHFGTLLAGVPDNTLLFLYGGGRNGKSKLVGVMVNILVNYSVSIKTSVFTVIKYAVDKDRVFAKLLGARLAYASETDQGAIWNEALIKQVTGGDRLPARFL
jgi:putative DNA primase/helicase